MIQKLEGTAIVQSKCLHGNLLMNLSDLTISLRSGRKSRGLAGASCVKCLYINMSIHEYAWLWGAVGHSSAETKAQHATAGWLAADLHD